MSQKGRKSRSEAARFPEFAMRGRGLVAAVAAGVAVLALLAVLAGLMVFSPRWALRQVQEAAASQLGRSFTAESAALGLSPLSVHFEGAALSGATGTADSLISARSMVMPLTWGGLFARRADPAEVTLRGADIALQIDEQGKAGWDFPEARPEGTLRLVLEESSLRYFDARSGHSLSLPNASGVLTAGADGGIAFAGSAIVNAQPLRIALMVKSLPRVHEDGSPIDLTVASELASLTFSGRLSTARVLSLAGPLGIESANPAGALRWAGIPLSEAAGVAQPFVLEGALDSAGRAYAIRNAAVGIGAFRGLGDIVADLRGSRPKLQANLEADSVWLDALIPAAGAGPGEWGRTALPFSLLRSFDAEVSLLARAASYGGFPAGLSRFTAALADGKLDASGGLRLAGGGTLGFTARIDSVVLPPALSLSLKAEDAEVSALLAALGAGTWMSGSGNLDAALTAAGTTQEELAATLKGTAALNVPSGLISGLDTGALAATLLSRIADGWGTAPGSTAFTGLAASVTLEDGIATLGSAGLEAAGMTVGLSGTVDLLRRALDLRASLGPEDKAPLPVPAVISGNWAAPRIYPDVPDILNNPEGGFARLRSALQPPGD